MYIPLYFFFFPKFTLSSCHLQVLKSVNHVQVWKKYRKVGLLHKKLDFYRRAWPNKIIAM